MALMHSNGMPQGTPAPDFSLPAVDGRTYQLASFADAKVLVIVFTCNHCPYAKASEERLVAIQRDYGPRGVAVVAINPNDPSRYADDSFDGMVTRAREKGFNFPYLHDASQAVARAYDAACTPDIYVFDEGRRLVCQSRIDDNWQDASKVTRHDLRAVLDAVLAKQPLPFEPIASMGCSIKWKSPTA